MKSIYKNLSFLMNKSVRSWAFNVPSRFMTVSESQKLEDAHKTVENERHIALKSWLTVFKPNSMNVGTINPKTFPMDAYRKSCTIFSLIV